MHAPESLRRRVEESLIQAKPSEKSSDGFGVHEGGRKGSVNIRWIGVAAVFLAVVASSVLVLAERSRGASRMRASAVRAEQDLEQGRLPLDINSSSAQEVSAWLGSRLSFPFHMANSGIASDDRANYKLVGGRVVSVNGERAALLSFRLPDEQVSMLVGPGNLPIDTWGKVIHSGNVTLHPREQDGMHIVSWRNRGLSYVLVSRSSMKNVSGCGRCHQNRPSAVEAERERKLYPRFLATISMPGLQLKP
ncbi:hypothetical protein [Silvibacterium acidisoli]|uniref:hypothetical protein n=1 Tax=Acidobacteriaceae bacterium ZG23-2 TaxID=2883246 RepID=UPI00406CA662